MKTSKIDILKCILFDGGLYGIRKISRTSKEAHNEQEALIYKNLRFQICEEFVFCDYNEYEKLIHVKITHNNIESWAINSKNLRVRTNNFLDHIFHLIVLN
jgi:hypothetical protein